MEISVSTAREPLARSVGRCLDRRSVLSADPAHGTVRIPPGDAFTGATHNVISLAVNALVP